MFEFHYILLLCCTFLYFANDISHCLLNINFKFYRFTVNLLTGLDQNSDRPFHLSVRFHSRTAVRNALQQNNWGKEETHGLFPFATGKNFTMLILVDQAAYRVRKLCFIIVFS